MSEAPKLAPVTCGSDLGVYSIARSFHEAYGVPTTTVAGLPRGFINDSRIVSPVLLGEGMTDAGQVEALLRIGGEARARGDHPLLIVNSDSLVDMVCAARDRLEEVYTLLVSPNDSVAAVTDKARLAPLAATVGLATPQEVVLDGTDPGDIASAVAPLGTPFILKPATSIAWERVTFPGKLKVYECASAADAKRVVAAAAEVGYKGRFLAQELVPGDDTYGYVITVYIDRSGVPTLRSTARMLLALHTPNLLGNMALGLVDWYPHIAQPVTQMLQDLGYRGFATVDVKIHARTGTPYLLDVNPRVGRSNYFITMGGTNPMQVAVDDALGVAREPERTFRRGLFRIVPARLLRTYVEDPALRREVAEARSEGRTVHPLEYGPDRSPKRTAFRLAASLNHLRYFRATYPRPTDSGL